MNRQRSRKRRRNARCDVMLRGPGPLPLEESSRSCPPPPPTTRIRPARQPYYLLTLPTTRQTLCLSPLPTTRHCCPPSPSQYTHSTTSRPWQVHPPTSTSPRAGANAQRRLQSSESRLYTISVETRTALRKFRLGTSRAKDPQAVICTYSFRWGEGAGRERERERERGK